MNDMPYYNPDGLDITWDDLQKMTWKEVQKKLKKIKKIRKKMAKEEMKRHKKGISIFSSEEEKNNFFRNFYENYDPIDEERGWIIRADKQKTGNDEPIV